VSEKILIGAVDQKGALRKEVGKFMDFYHCLYVA